MAPQPIEIRVIQPGRPAPTVPTDDEPTFPRYDGPAFLSYGFRPFFLGAALFAGLAVPAWVLIFSGALSLDALYPAREWHVHEMLFGFLPAVMAGFLLTAVPNWTERLPLRGRPLLALWLLWVAGRVVVVAPWPAPVVAAVVDGAFLVALAAYLWRELATAGSWMQAPIAVLITLYALTNGWFHAQALHGLATDLPERMVVSILMLLLTLIGGRLVPNFTREYVAQRRLTPLPPAFTKFDAACLGLVLVSALSWIAVPESALPGWLFLAAGVMNLVRLGRWSGRLAWPEPLVFVLHVGYGWLVLSMGALGAALLGIGLSQAEALHVLTTGAVGTMTLAVMTRASLGHTGRPKQADRATMVMYALVSLGALLRVTTPTVAAPTASTHVLLGLAALCWSGAYLLFALLYGPYLWRPSVDE